MTSISFSPLKPLTGLLWLQLLHGLVEMTVAIFITLYIWRTVSFGAAIQFKLLEAVVAPITAVIVGWCVDRWSPKWVLGFGLSALLITLLGLVGQGPAVAQWWWVWGMMMGVSAAARFVPLNTLQQNAVTTETQQAYFGQVAINSRVVSVVWPLISGGLISWFGYTPIFVLTFLAASGMLAVLVKTSFQDTRSPYRLQQLFAQWTPIKTALWQTYFLWGIEFGVWGVLVPIATVQIVRGEGWWGIVTAGTALLSACYAWWFKKQHQRRMAESIVGVFAFLLSATALSFAASNELITFLVFLTVLSLWQTTQNIGIRPLVNDLVKQDPELAKVATEYQVFGELPFGIGRSISLLALLIMQNDFQYTVVLGVLFVVIGLVPLYEGKAITRLQHRFLPAE